MATDENNKFQCYIEERKLLYNALVESGKLFDKSILTISAGTFGLTITFLRNIAPEIKTETIFMLHYAWIYFSISIVVTLFSYLTSHYAFLKQIDILDLSQKNENQNKDFPNYLSYITGGLNILSVIAFFVGVIFLINFSIKNM